MIRLDSDLFSWFFRACLMWPKYFQNKSMQENRAAPKHELWGGEETLVSNTTNISENIIFHFTVSSSESPFFPQNKPDQKKKTQQKTPSQNPLKRSEWWIIFHTAGCRVIAFLFNNSKTTWESLQIPLKIAGNNSTYRGPHSPLQAILSP